MNRLVLFVLFFALVAGAVGCKTTAPVVSVSNRDSVSVSTRDSFHSTNRNQRDTTYIDRWHTKEVKGDSVFIHDSIYVFNGKEIEVHDTVSTTTTDTVTVIKNDSTIIYVPVEKELSRMQTAAMNTGYATWALIALLLIAGIIFVAVKIRL